MSCVGPPTGAGFLAATLAHLDCQAQNIGEAGYQALASPGSPLQLALTALLAIFVAVIGLRYLTNRPLAVDEWVSGALKVGLVLALAASWPAYRTVVYDLVLKGPAEISGLVGRASALPGSDGGLVARLQGVDIGIMKLVEAGSGRLDITSRRPIGEIAPPLADDTTLGWGKTLFISSILGSLGLLRMGGGIFLALAPMFAGFMLFQGTRFLFFGWLRALIAIAIGSIGITIILGVQLALMEPWLAQVLALRAARIATLSAPFELLALTLSFSLAMLGLFIFALRIAYASDAITKVQVVIERAAQSLQQEAAAWRPFAADAPANQAEQTRAQEIAQSMRQALNLDRQSAAGPDSRGRAPNRAALAGDAGIESETKQIIPPLGRSYPAPSRRLGSQSLKRK